MDLQHFVYGQWYDDKKAKKTEDSKDINHYYWKPIIMSE